jgi:hypothetical protein
MYVIAEAISQLEKGLEMAVLSILPTTRFVKT